MNKLLSYELSTRVIQRPHHLTIDGKQYTHMDTYEMELLTLSFADHTTRIYSELVNRDDLLRELRAQMKALRLSTSEALTVKDTLDLVIGLNQLPEALSCPDCVEDVHFTYDARTGFITCDLCGQILK